MVKQDSNLIYSGVVTEENARDSAELIRTRLSQCGIPPGMVKSIFSVYVEQATNVLMHSADGHLSGEQNLLTLEQKGPAFYIQTHNIMKRSNAEFLKHKIDKLNLLDKEQLRALRREQMRSENENPESKGAGLGLIEIARQATAPIEYVFQPRDNDTVYITISVEICGQSGEKGCLNNAF